MTTLTYICCIVHKPLPQVFCVPLLIGCVLTYVMTLVTEGGEKRVLKPEESPTFVETYKEMEKLLETGGLW